MSNDDAKLTKANVHVSFIGTEPPAMWETYAVPATTLGPLMETDDASTERVIRPTVIGAPIVY